jgi:hypothetical protein
VTLGAVVLGGALTREWMTPGESARVRTLNADKVAGVVFTPPPGTPKHPGVVLSGGAEGGMSQVYAAALLAAHGYPSLSVAYFDWPGLPVLAIVVRQPRAERPGPARLDAGRPGHSERAHPGGRHQRTGAGAGGR